MTNKTKLIVNFFGVPGSGKSTMAARLFADLKMQGLDVELVREYAKELLWEGEDLNKITQLEITLEQIRRTLRLLDKVSIIITDSPVFGGMLYVAESEKLAKTYMKNHHLALAQHCVNVNIMVEPGATYGRTQESLNLKDKLIELLEDNQIDYATSDKNHSAIILYTINLAINDLNIQKN